jgi:hypothetical protein
MMEFQTLSEPDFKYKYYGCCPPKKHKRDTIVMLADGQYGLFHVSPFENSEKVAKRVANAYEKTNKFIPFQEYIDLPERDQKRADWITDEISFQTALTRGPHA